MIDAHLLLNLFEPLADKATEANSEVYQNGNR